MCSFFYVNESETFLISLFQEPRDTTLNLFSCKRYGHPFQTPQASRMDTETKLTYNNVIPNEHNNPNFCVPLLYSKKITKTLRQYFQYD